MSAMRCLVRVLAGLGIVILLTGLQGWTAAAHAQEDEIPPSITISPPYGSFPTATIGVSIEWCDNETLNASSRVIKLNGVTITSNFGYSTYGYPCAATAYSNGNVTLQSGSNTLYTYICDTGWLCTSETVTLTYDAGKQAAIVTDTLQSRDRFEPSMCAMTCAVHEIAYSTPAYRSLDQDRSTTLLYRSDQAQPVPMVLLEVRDPSTDPADTISIRLKQDWSGAWQTLHTGGTEVYYDNPQTNNHTSYVAVGINAGSLATGSYDYTAYIYSRWRDGTVRETQKDVRVLVVNEKNSPYGWGWSIAGLQKIHSQALGGPAGVVVTDGSGGIAFLPQSCSTQSGETYCSYTEPAGWVGDLEYDTEFVGYRYRRFLPDGGMIKYDDAGRMTSANDRFGNTTTYAYDGSGRVSSITDPAGKVTTFGYGGDGKLAWIKDPGNRQSTVTINGSYDVTQIQDPGGANSLQGMIYSSHRMTVYKDRANSQWDVAYDFAGRLRTVTAPSVKIFDGSSVRPADTIMSAQSYLMDAASSLASPGANRTATMYKVRVADPLGHETIIRTPSPFGQPGLIDMERSRSARFLYNSIGHVTREVSPTGDSTSYVWSGDRMTQRTLHATGQVVNYEYTTYDELSRIYGTGLPDVRHHFSSGTRDSTTVNGAKVARYTWDAKGRLATSHDAENFQQQYAYYATGFQNASSATTAGQTTTFTYDSYGRPRYVINPVQDTAIVNYDAINRITFTRNEAGDTTYYGYNNMFRTSVTDAVDNVFRNYPNALGWDTAFVDPGNRTEVYRYDRDGAVRSYVNRRSQTVSHTYNEAHERVSTTADGMTTTYSISTDFLAQTASNTHSTDTIKFNRSGQVLEEVTRRSGVRFQVLRGYDAQMRPDSINIWRNGGWQNRVTYSYDTAGRLSSLSATNAGSTTIGYDPRFNAETFRWSATSDTLRLKYPAVGAPGSFAYSDATTQALAGLSYLQDSLSRITERWNGDQTEGYEFLRDPIGQIYQVKEWGSTGGGSCEWDPERGYLCYPSTPVLLNVDTLNWDAVGNPSGETVDAGDRLRTLGSISLTYDADGNITQRSGAGETVTYWWNSLSQLDSANSSVNGKVRYKYDGFGRRISTHDAIGTTQFLWDGQNVVADIDGAGALTRFYNYYPGLSNLHSLRVGSSGYLYVKDLTGNVLGLQNSSGTMVNQYAYSAFGELTSVSEGVANRFRFASGEQDRIGLYYFRARYYEPEYRRFISEDPIGLAGGINPYVYAANDPIGMTDRTGLEPCPEEMNADDEPCPIEIPGVVVIVPGGNGDQPISVVPANSAGWGWGGSGGGGASGGSRHGGPECVAGVLSAAYAVAEDAATLLGAGLVLKGVRGATLSIQLARTGGWMVAERLALPHAGVVVSSRALSRVPLSHLGTIFWDASTTAAMGGEYTLSGSALSLIPIYNAFRAITSARGACSS